MFTTLIPTALVAVLSPDAPAAPVPLAPSSTQTDEEALTDEDLLVPVAEGEKLNEWEGSLAGGVFLSFGNTERITANILFDAVYRRPGDRFTLGGWWYFGRETVTDETTGAENDETTDDRYGGRAQYDYFLSEKSYLLAMGLAEHDSNANVDLRATAGVGYGYQFVDQEDLQYSAEVGVNYFATTYIEVPPGEPEDDNRMTARIASDLTWHPAEEWSLGNLIETYPPLESGKNWYTRADTRIRYDLSEVIFTQLQWLVDYNSEPAPNSKSTDHRLFFTVGWNF